jgi:hypothetical protein
MRGWLMAKYLILTVIFVFGSSVFASGHNLPKEWTVMVFVNGHNNLSPYATKDLNEMEMVGSTSSINVVTQWASMESTTTKRMLMQKDQDFSTVTSPILQDLPRVDMGDYRSLVDFVKWSVQNFPAKKYMIIVWNHGMGWHGVPEEKMEVLDISSDDISGNAITTVQLGVAMEQSAKLMGHKVDLYGSDACSMASLEVATEMKDSVQYFLGSEELEGSEGWDYHRFLLNLANRPTADALELGKFVADTYLESNPDGGEMGGVTFSVINASHLDALLFQIADLSKQIQALSDEDASEVYEAANMAQRFWYDDDYRDLGDFLGNLEILTRDPDETSIHIQRASVEQLQATFKKVVAYNVRSPKYWNAHGLTIWLPLTAKLYHKFEKDYAQLKFQGLTDWGSALKKLAKE